MLNRLVVLVIGLSMLAAAVGLALLYSPEGSATGGELLGWGLQIGQVSSLLLLLHNGRIVGTGYFRGILACFGVTLVGALFKIMHWPWGDELLLASLASIAGIYLAWFASKKPKKRLDALKLAWVLAACLGGAGVVEHWLPREFTYLTNCLLWLAVGDFVVTDFAAGNSAAKSKVI